MSHAERLAAIIVIIAEILERAAAAERVVTVWQRRSRFAGAKYRRAVADMVYAVLRDHAEDMQAVDLARIGFQDAAIELLGFRQLPGVVTPERKLIQSVDAGRV